MLRRRPMGVDTGLLVLFAYGASLAPPCLGVSNDLPGERAA